MSSAASTTSVEVGRSSTSSAGGEPPAKLPVTRSELSTRWLILLLLNLVLFGNYYAYDTPSASLNALADRFDPSTLVNGTAVVDDDGASSDTSSFSFRFNLLYSLYSWPNVILPFFGGVFTDRLGVRLMTLVFITLCTVGQAVFAFGTTMAPGGDAAWGVMWLGRIFFGLGGESLSVAVSAALAQWFSGKELALALGANLALARVGSVINDVVSAQLSARYPVYVAMWAGFAVCALSLVAGLVAFYVDAEAEERLRINRGLRPRAPEGLLAALRRAACGAARPPPAGAAAAAAGTAALLAGDGAVDGAADGGAIDEPPKEEIDLRAVLRFPAVFWVLTLSCVTVYCDVLPFNNIAAGFIAQKWLTNVPIAQVAPADKSGIYVQANNIMLTTYLMAGLLSPLLGGAIDRVGYRAALNVAAAAAIVGVHAMLAFTSTVPPAVPLVLLGICYSVYASALWPSVALVVPAEAAATAYGVVTAVQNLGLAVAPLAIGALMPSASCATYAACVAGYTRVEVLLIALGAVGVASGVALNVADARARYPVLRWTSARLAAAQAADAAAAEGGGGDAEDVRKR